MLCISLNERTHLFHAIDERHVDTDLMLPLMTKVMSKGVSKCLRQSSHGAKGNSGILSIHVATMCFELPFCPLIYVPSRTDMQIIHKLFDHAHHGFLFATITRIAAVVLPIAGLQIFTEVCPARNDSLPQNL